MRTKFYELPGHLVSEFDSEVKAVINLWTNYSITLEEFKEAVFVNGVNHAKNYGAVAFITDAKDCTGEFSPEIQKFIATDVLPTFTKIGVKYFLIIKSGYIYTNKTIETFTSTAGPNGLKLIEADSTPGAIAWLKKYA